MTTVFSLQKSILPSILNCIRITHDIVLYYSYQLLEIIFVIFPLINKDNFQIILCFICFCISKDKLVSSLKHFSRNANCVQCVFAILKLKQYFLFFVYKKKQLKYLLFVNQLSTFLRNKRFRLFS